MADKRVVYLKFATVDGKSASITISGPRTGLTLEQAKTAANALVILGSGDAPLASFTSASEVSTQSKDLQ